MNKLLCLIAAALVTVGCDDPTVHPGCSGPGCITVPVSTSCTGFNLSAFGVEE